jgi:putative nucleotidyltransferase with HDIG domain
MSSAPTVEEQELLADSYRRAGSGLTARERDGELVIGVGFAAALAAVWAISPPHGFRVMSAAVCMAVLALATMVRFDTPFGFTVPTQVAFVPLVFAVPAAIAPLAVVAALALGRLSDVLKGEIPASRLLFTPGNAWFAIGPALVFALAGVEPRDAALPLLVAALAAQFVSDFSASTLRYEIAREASLSAQLRESWGVYLIDAALSGVGLLAAEQVNTTPAAVLLLVPLLAVLAFFAHERRQRLQSLLELGHAYRGTALVLGDVVEADDGYTGEHSKSVVTLALEVAQQLNLAPQQRQNLEFGALLHDVGKIAIPKRIINKPGPLDPAEWMTIKTHTIEGQRMLDRVGGFMHEVGLIVRSHHERWDGTGYPDGLRAEAIPLEARIITCCDSWNAMRTDRPYRPALSYDAASAELRTNSGTQFDPRIVDALLAIVAPVAHEVTAPQHATSHDHDSVRARQPGPGPLRPEPDQM